MNKNNNIPGPFSHLPIFAEATEDDGEIMRPLSIEDEMRIFYENKYKREYERKLKEYQQAFEQGRTEGEASGRAEREIEMARALKDRGVSIEIIAETSGLSAEEIDKL